MSRPIGEIIGSCRIEALLGASETGEVYRARHIHAGVTLAVRLLAANMQHSDDLRAAFHQEAQIAALLEHPHIVRVFESGEWNGRGFFVMEYMGGGSLADLIRRVGRAGRPLPLGLCLDLARQAAEALAYAHRPGVVHGELRPSSLLIQPDHDRPARLHLKVGDFGLARLGIEMLAVGGISAPPLYLAPEQFQGHPPDARSDIYSLGLALYEALAGRPAYPAASYAEAVRHQLAGAPPSLRHLRPDLPPEVELLILRCLARDPEQRTQDAAELAHVIAQLSRPFEPAAAAD